MFDDIMGLLDSPRQAITNLARGAFGDDIDPLGMLPGGLGLLGSMALGATGVGLPLAILGGSLMGGGAQFGGTRTGNSAFKAPTAEEVAKGMFGSGDFLPSLAAGLLTDPLTYAGGIGGSRVGGRIGKGIEETASVVGPGYSGRGSLLDAMAHADAASAAHGIFPTSSAAERLRQLHPGEFDRIASEVPEGSTFLGNGVERVALRTPTGDVISVGPVADTFGLGRPVDPIVNRATRTVDLPPTKLNGAGYRAERSPLAEMRDSDFWYGPQGGQMRWDTMDGGIERGLRMTDVHAGNLGLVGGKPVVIDPGSVYHTQKFSGSFEPVTIADPSAELGTLGRLLGAQGRLRGTLEGTRDDMGLERLLSRMGAGAGIASSALPKSL